MVRENKRYLTLLFSALRLTALQQISQRGHKHSGDEKGNVHKIMKLVAEYDPIVKERLLKGPKMLSICIMIFRMSSYL